MNSPAESEGNVPYLTELASSDQARRRAAVDSLVEESTPEQVAELVSQVQRHHRNLPLLSGALEVLARTPVDCLALLAQGLQDEDPELRTYTALVLGARGDARAVPLLLAALRDENVNVRSHAIESLGKLQASEASEALLEIALAGDFFLAYTALAALGAIGDRRVGLRLLTLLENELLQEAVLGVLGELGSATVAEQLVRRLDRADEPASHVVTALARICVTHDRLYRTGRSTAQRIARSLSDAGQQRVLAEIGRAGESELPGLLQIVAALPESMAVEALVSALDRPEAQEQAIELLVGHGSRAIAPLLRRAQTSEAAARPAILAAFGRLGARGAMPLLIEALDEGGQLANVAAGALARIGEPSAYPSLRDRLATPDPQLRRALLAAINSLGHSDREPDMLRQLEDPNPMLRSSAVAVAAYLGGEDCTQAVLHCCHDPVASVRQAAVDHLGWIEDPRIEQYLVEALDDPEPLVRAAAARSLAQQSGSWAGELLRTKSQSDSDPWVRYFAVRSLEHHLQPADAGRLLELAHSDPAPPVRLAATRALGTLGWPGAVPALLQLARSADPDLVQVALEALAALRHPRAVQALVTMACDRTLHPLALVTALGQTASAEAVPILVDLARGAAQPQLSQTAIQALSQLRIPEAIMHLVELLAIPVHREACLRLLGEMGPAEVPWIAESLEHELVEVRRGIVEILGRIGGEDAAGPLSFALGDEEPAVRFAALACLAESGHLPPKTQLVELTEDADASVRQLAQAVLQG